MLLIVRYWWELSYTQISRQAWIGTMTYNSLEWRKEAVNCFRNWHRGVIVRWCYLLYCGAYSWVAKALDLRSRGLGSDYRFLQLWWKKKKPWASLWVHTFSSYLAVMGTWCTDLRLDWQLLLHFALILPVEGKVRYIYLIDIWAFNRFQMCRSHYCKCNAQIILG